MTVPLPFLSATQLRLAAALEDWPRRTLTLTELWGLWDQADPGAIGTPHRRADLARALHALTGAQLVRPSKTADRSATPPLPTRLTLPRPAPTPTAAELARITAWRPELAWAVTARLTLGQVTQLRHLNTWLRDRSHDTDTVPLRERSLEILGHEKVLDRLITTSLFAPGRLTLDLLRTFRTHPPLPSRRVGDGPILLVVENDDTFHSAWSVLREGPGDVGSVAWGAGAAFEASVRSVADLPGITEVRYFGDLDPDGLRIPANAAACAEREHLPPVRPALPLYRRLLNSSLQQPGHPPLDPTTARRLAAWLHSDADTGAAATQAVELLSAGIRIPQEAVGLNLLRADTGWINLR